MINQKIFVNLTLIMAVLNNNFMVLSERPKTFKIKVYSYTN